MKRPKGFSLLELLIVVSIILVIATMAIPSLLRSRQSAHETAAVGTLKTLSTAQISYTTISGGVYGTMPELIGAQLVDPRFNATMSGYDYRFDMAAGQRDYTAYATAASSNDGRYDYYTRPDFVIRFSDTAARAPLGLAGAPVQ